ncbi:MULTISPECIES: nucleoside-diphosphate kinase [unclassified Bradyrhizobium]|uniref:nucleoside-diphosphate kinase n=1 Tax=unclassified Bradyrhizobium TaxID=2631580 RepID=UPI0028ED14E2|nr:MULTISPECIES: nucleoside-diphosphate kinase [unclassified Bradyrhizobium]
MDYLVEESDFTNSRAHLSILDWLRQFPDDDHRLLKDTIFTIILPDAIKGGKLLEISRRCIDEGYIPILTKVIMKSPERKFEELYKFNIANNIGEYCAEIDRGGMWWLNRRAYSTCPVVAMVLRKVSRILVTPHTDFRKLKGVASPYAAQPGQLRHDFEAVNRSLSLMHSSDEPLSTVRELRIFAGDAAFGDLVVRARQAQTQSGLQSLCRECMFELQRSEAALRIFREQTDFLKILNGIKLRVLADSGGHKLRGSSLLQREMEIVNTEEALAQRTRNFIKLARKSTASLSGLAGTDALSRCFALLSEPEAFSADVARDITHLLQAIEIPFTEWEEIVLLTSMHHWKETGMLFSS